MKKLKLFFKLFKSLWNCEEYFIVISKRGRNYDEEQNSPIYYEYHNNTNRKIFYLFALDHLKELYGKAKDETCKTRRSGL